MLGKRKILGLAVTDRSITAVEVAASNGGGRMRRAAEFAFPEGVGLDAPAELGKALKRFLRQERFSASRCVIGVQASCLTARRKTIPPAADDAVPQMLNLMIEREFASDREGLVFDYAPGDAEDGQLPIFLVAAPRAVVEGLAAMAAAAGLTVACITPSTQALACAAGEAGARDQFVLHLFAGAAELVHRRNGQLRLMRRLATTIPADPSDGWLTGLTEELYRVLALLPTGGEQAESRELIVWGGGRRGERACGQLSDSLQLPVRSRQWPEGLDVPADASLPAGSQASAAAVLAIDALQGRRPSVDLLHSRLTLRRKLSIGRKAAWAAGVAAAILIFVGAALLEWRSDVRQAADLRTELAEMEGDRDRAQAVIDKVTFARPWYGRRLSYLEGIRELTLAFPAEGTIWTTSLAVKENMEAAFSKEGMQVAFSGKAVSQSAVLDVLDRLRANPRLGNVKQGPIRKSGKGGREVAFDMSFSLLEARPR